MGILRLVLSLASPKCRPLNKYVILNLNLSSQRLKKLNVNHRRRRLFLFEKVFVFKFSQHVYRRRQGTNHFGKIFLEPQEQFTSSHDLSRLS